MARSRWCAAATARAAGAVAEGALTRGLARGEGTIGAMLADDRLYERMAAATTELAGLLATINRSGTTATPTAAAATPGRSRRTASQSRPTTRRRSAIEA